MISSAVALLRSPTSLAAMLAPKAVVFAAKPNVALAVTITEESFPFLSLPMANFWSAVRWAYPPMSAALTKSTRSARAMLAPGTVIVCMTPSMVTCSVLVASVSATGSAKAAAPTASAGSP